jgi:uncharacterized protein (TIGR03032 family)
LKKHTDFEVDSHKIPEMPQQGSTAPAPFSCTYSPNLPELLMQLNCSLAISTYQAGKVIFLSPKDVNYLVQLPRNFQKPMGFNLNEKSDQLALACRDEVIVFSNSADLAKHYPKGPGKYDALYMPRLTYHTGPMDIHDLSFGSDDKLYAVNTLFSCIMSLDSQYNWQPYWQPAFIDRLVSEDRCHLNGMAMENGKPRYATAFGTGNTPQSWRETLLDSGVIFDLEANEVLAEGLAMPHSPRLFNNRLYVLLSATGELVEIDRATGEKNVITKIDGFVRGMAMRDDYLFIGLSKLRKNSSTFAKLPFAEKALDSGIEVIHLPTGSKAAKITYQTSVDEIYDVHIIADKLRPNILNTLTDDHKMGLMIPGSTYWAKGEKK